MQNLLLMLLHDEDAHDYTTRFMYRIYEEGRHLLNSLYPLRAIQALSMSAFTTVFGSGCNQSLITLCGLDHYLFRILLGLFETTCKTFPRTLQIGI